MTSIRSDLSVGRSSDKVLANGEKSKLFLRFATPARHFR